MITTMGIKNYKNFKNLQLSDVSRITLLGGRNNVGKTSLLEAIFLFYDPGDPGMFFRHLAWRGFQAATANPDTLFAPAFRNFDIEHQKIKIDVHDDIYYGHLEVAFDSSYAQKSISVDLTNNTNIIPQMQTDSNPLMSYALDIHYSVDGYKDIRTRLIVTQNIGNLNLQFEPNLVNPFPEAMMRGAIFLPLRWREDLEQDALRFGQLDIDKKSKQILDFLKIVEPSIEGLAANPVAPQKSMVFADIGIDRKIPITFMGDGMSRLLSIILAIATVKKGIVLIDEIDAGIHHSIMAKVWEGICRAAHEFNCQIIATTHSYECVQAAYAGATLAGSEHNFSYIRLDRKGEDVEGKTYSHKVLGAALERGWEVR